MRIEYNARDKVKIADPDNRSPDFADSLMLAIAYERNNGRKMDVGSYPAQF